jgi:hypothetical protein
MCMQILIILINKKMCMQILIIRDCPSNLILTLYFFLENCVYHSNICNCTSYYVFFFIFFFVLICVFYLLMFDSHES